MTLRLTVCGLFWLPHALDQTRGYTVPVDEVLSVMPRSETQATGPAQWRDTALPRHVVAVFDLGCGALYSDAEIAEILLDHPDQIPPTMAHVDAILAVGRLAIARGQASDWHLLIHCHGGTSRSVAAAYIILALQAGPGNEHLAYADLVRVLAKPPISATEPPDPNHNLVQLADARLGTGGRLLALVEAGLA